MHQNIKFKNLVQRPGSLLNKKAVVQKLSHQTEATFMSTKRTKKQKSLLQAPFLVIFPFSQKKKWKI